MKYEPGTMTEMNAVADCLTLMKTVKIDLFYLQLSPGLNIFSVHELEARF